MSKKYAVSLAAFSLGLLLSLLIIIAVPWVSPTTNSPLSYIPFLEQKEVIGFLPYWLLEKASPDYSQYITTLTYFALRIDKDGSIQKLTNPTQEESGWYALRSGKVGPFLSEAKKHNIKLSLTIDSGDAKAINGFIAEPARSAHILIADVKPIMQKYGFSDLNLDIEDTEPATDEARKQFVQFVKAVREDLPNNDTLTLEISPIDAIAQHLIDIQHVAPYVSHVVIMSYDYHAPDSTVTGPVAPLSGAGTVSEYDVTTAVEKTLSQMPSQKLILGLPLYGYEWETLGTIPRSAVIPGSGTIASNRRAEQLLATCATCSATMDGPAQEKYISYFATDTNTNHIIFYPDKAATSAKISFAKDNHLGGLALWALGYEGNTMLSPLTAYKN